MNVSTKLICIIFAIAATAPAKFEAEDYREDEKDKWEVQMGAMEYLENGGEKTFKVRFSDTPRPAFIGVQSQVGPIRLEVYDPNGKLIIQKNPGQYGWSQTNGIVSIAPQNRGDEYTIKVSGVGKTYCFTHCHLIKTKR